MRNEKDRWTMQRIGRREFLRTAGIMGASTLASQLIGCASSPAAPSTPGGSGVAVQPTSTLAAAAKAIPQIAIYTEGIEIRSLDPHNAAEGQSLHTVRAAYEALAAYVPGSAEIEPRLATKWTISDDAQVYTFTLQKGVKFQDGTLMDATAVKKSFERVMKLGTAQTAMVSDIDQIKVVDESTVQIILKKPNAYYLANIPIIMIVSPTAFEKNDKGGDMGAAWLEQNTAGTGPYRLTEYRRNEQHVVERFEGYWRGWAGNHLSKIVFQIVPEVQTRRQMLEKGEADFIGTAAPEDAKALQSVASAKIIISPSFNIYTYVINVLKPPLNDVRVRKAIQYAFDYQGFLDKVLLGNGTIPSGPLPPGYPSFNKEMPPFKQDLEAAKKLLAEAGAANIRIECQVIENNVVAAAAGAILQDALKKLGVDLQTKATPWATTFKMATNKDTAPNMMHLMIPPIVGDPAFSLRWPFSCRLLGQPYNWSWYCDDKVDKLIDAAAATIDKAKSYQLLQEAQKIIVDAAPVLWYCQPGNFFAVSSRVHNYVPNLLDYPGMVDWYQVYLA